MGLFSKIRSGLYKTAKLMGDASAIKNGNNTSTCEKSSSRKNNWKNTR